MERERGLKPKKSKVRTKLPISFLKKGKENFLRIQDIGEGVEEEEENINYKIYICMKFIYIFILYYELLTVFFYMHKQLRRRRRLEPVRQFIYMCY